MFMLTYFKYETYSLCKMYMANKLCPYIQTLSKIHLQKQLPPFWCFKIVHSKEYQ